MHFSATCQWLYVFMGMAKAKLAIIVMLNIVIIACWCVVQEVNVKDRQAKFTDASGGTVTVNYDLLLGADGVNSKVRWHKDLITVHIDLPYSACLKCVELLLMGPFHAAGRSCKGRSLVSGNSGLEGCTVSTNSFTE